MTAVIIALGILMVLGIFIMIAPAVGIVAFFAMIYFFATGAILYAICALVVWCIAMSIGEETTFISIRKW